MVDIPERLHDNNFRFILLGHSGEELKKPFETGWDETSNYQHDDPKLLNHRGNYGVAGGFGDLHILDSDDLDRWVELGILKLIPLTYTIESRLGHRQFYVKCKEHFKSGGLFDPEKTEINKDGKLEYIHVGDIKAGAKEGKGICGGQAVGPGCKHPSGSIYTVVEDQPIVEVSGEVIKSILAKFKTSKKVNTNYQRLEDDVTKARQRKYSDKDPFDALQVVDIMPPAGNVSQSGDELRGDHPVHGSTNGGNYVINVSKNVWHCKRCESGGGPALAIAVKHGLISCSDAQAGELRGDLFKQVLEIAKENYGLQEGSVGKPELLEISEEDLLKIKMPENPRFKTNLEADNFIQGYIRYGETVTDSYPDYWFAGGLFCLSVAVNRNAVIKLRQGPIYPNVWINDLGISSLSRKSTSIDKTDLTIVAANIDTDCKMPDEFSPEAMIERLAKHPRAYMIKDESAGLLAAMKKDYMRGLKDALMQLYDGKDINRELRTSRRKTDTTSFKVKEPYLCILLATTPGSFAANTELLDVTSGWLPRFLHFFPNHSKDRWMPLEEGVPENDIMSTACQDRLIKIRQAFYDRSEPLVMHLSKEADAYFKAWQKTREGELVEAKDDRRAQFYSRLAVYVLKMAMLFTIGRADYKEGLEISTDHIKEACRLVDEYFMPMAMVVADLVGKAADKNLMDKIIAVLTSRGGKITRRHLMMATHIKRKDLDEALESLEESGEVKLATVSNPKGPSTKWVILTTDNEYKNTVDNVETVYSLNSLNKNLEDNNGDGATVSTVSTNSTNATNINVKSSDVDSIADLLRQAEERAKDKEKHDRELVAKYSRPEELAVLIRMRAPYKTQFAEADNPNRYNDVELFEGDELLLSYDRARPWVKRGIADVVELGILYKPAEAEV